MTTIGPKVKATRNIRNTVRSPRNTNGRNLSSVMLSSRSKHVRKKNVLAHAKDFIDSNEKYLAKGFTRPKQGFPHGALVSLVLFDGEIDVDSGYPHNWRWKTIIVFGEAIMGVRGHLGRGVVSGSKPLEWWGVLERNNPSEALLFEIKRRLPNLYHN